jgi:hypothetical protein
LWNGARKMPKRILFMTFLSLFVAALTALLTV